MLRSSVALVLLWSMLALPAFAAPQPPFAGRWALWAGGRVILLLTLEPASAGSGFTGELIAPRRFSIPDSGAAVTDVQGPLKSERLERAVPQGNGLTLSFQSPDDPKQTNEADLRLTGVDTAALMLRGAPFPALTLTRVGSGVRPEPTWDADAAYRIDVPEPTNPEMTGLFEADQADRKTARIEWSKVSPADAGRRAATRRLLDAGSLHSGADFLHAAFVFQHGDEPSDFLLAHTLAMIAIAKGRADAIWIAAATLDRYLQSVSQPQVYGTQFRTRDVPRTTQEPFDRTLISDALRAALGVPSLSEQEKQRAGYDARLKP